jgi:rhamnulokinase
MSAYAAIDLGATSGRVAVGSVVDGAITFEIVHRFLNEPFTDPEHGLLWNWTELQREVLIGLHKAKEKYDLTSVGVDTWAVDYQIIEKNGDLNPRVYSYRNHRLDSVMENTIKLHGKEKIYNATGIQFLPFNTIYQLIAGASANEFSNAAKFLLLPDALSHYLCGSTTQEVTNASTTQLLNPTRRDWDWDLIRDLDLPTEIFPALHEAGANLGHIRGHGDLDGISVVAVGSHDTASAVAAVPMTTPESSIYISSGTWSLVGYEKKVPNLSSEALKINLTNELGVQGTVRLLRNVAGMWLISECQKDWAKAGIAKSIEELIAEAEKIPTDSFLINPNDSSFLHPGDMVGRIQKICEANGVSVPKTPGEFARCIFDSLAHAYHDVILEFEEIENHHFDSIFIVGGGSANAFLNQLIANVTGKTVTAGPVEATLLGNIGVQAMAAGEISGLPELRRAISKSFEKKTFFPAK